MPIKVCHVINSLGMGGAEKLLLDTIPMYNAMGVTTDLLVFLDDDAPFLQEFRKQQFEHLIVFQKSKRVRDVYSPMHILRLCKYIRQYDIVHVHLFPAQYFVVLAKILTFSKCKLIFTEHSTTNKRMVNKYFQLIDRVFYKFYHHIVAISDEIQQILRRYTKQSNIITIENGVNLKSINEAEGYYANELSPQLRDGDVILIQVSAFRLGKDHKTLVHSLLHLPKNFKLVLVGIGTELETVRKIVADLKLTDRVVFLGARMDIPRIIKSADCLILSSLFEGLSLSSIECLATGIPFLATDAPGLNTIVPDDRYLFRPGDALDLAEKVIKVVGDKAYAQQMGKEGMSHVEQYSLENMVSKYINLYKNSING